MQTANLQRPQPPAELFNVKSPPFMPAPELEAWMRKTFLDEESPLWNPEHSHLKRAKLGVLWSGVPLSVRGARAAAFASFPDGMGSKFDRQLREMQMSAFFGKMPDFLLVFDARIAVESSDRTFCRRANHELTHCGHKKDKFGVPLYNKKPFRPKFYLRPHDREVFDSDIRLFGARAALGDAVDVILRAERMPEFSDDEIAMMCGTCAVR